MEIFESEQAYRVESLQTSPFLSFLTILAERFEIRIKKKGKRESLSRYRREQLSKGQTEKLKSIYLFSLAFGSPHLFLNRIEIDSEGEIFLCLGEFSEEEIRAFEERSRLIYPFTQVDREIIRKIEEEYNLKLNPQERVEQEFRQKLESLMPKDILQALKEAGFIPDKLRFLLRSYLRRREAWLNYLALEKDLREDPSWEDLDKILTKSRGNILRPLREEIIELDEALRDLESCHRSTSIISRVFDTVRRKKGDEKMDSAILLFQEVVYELQRYIGAAHSNISRKSYPLLYPSIRLLDGYYCVPREQIRKMEILAERAQRLIKLLGSNRRNTKMEIERLLKKYTEAVEQIKRWRVEFEEICAERSRGLVSHVSSPEAIEDIIKEGEVRSSLYQQVKEGGARAGSPYTERGELLAQIAFAVNGADLNYCKTEEDKAVALVAPYPSIARKGIFVEYPPTSASAYVYSSEFHLFNDEEPEEGIAIPVDGFFLCVPEKERQRWEDFLLRQESEGGAGKDKAWVEQHLITYPSDEIPLDVFLRYFFKVEPTKEKGVFVATDKEVVVHKFPGKEDRQRAFRWISASSFLPSQRGADKGEEENKDT